MNTIEQKILDAYIPHETTLRAVARACATDHHRVKRVLQAAGVAVVRGKRGPLTDEHKRNISVACKGRQSWIKGKHHAAPSLYKNMAAHLRFDVSPQWLMGFSDIERLKALNACVTRRGDRYNETSAWYMAYIERFYVDAGFNRIYTRWVNSGKCKYLQPSIDHMTPRSKGGTNAIENLRFLTWFENRCKNDMSCKEWDEMKQNLGDYLL